MNVLPVQKRLRIRKNNSALTNRHVTGLLKQSRDRMKGGRDEHRAVCRMKERGCSPGMGPRSFCGFRVAV